MALFKSLRGKRENLPSSKTDGYAYFCTDDGTFWIDYTDDSGVVQRKQINAKDAETFSGMTKEELQNALDAKVPITRTINGKALSSNITLSSSDVSAAPASHTSDSTIHVTTEEKATWNAKADAPFKPAGKSYLTFSSPNSFTLKVNDTTKHWDGTLEYFSADKEWIVWDGTATLTAVGSDGEYVLYIRGTGNTVITGNKSSYRWVLTGADVKCSGNIETLLDYATVEAGNHPTMADYCYSYMFCD